MLPVALSYNTNTFPILMLALLFHEPGHGFQHKPARCLVILRVQRVEILRVRCRHRDKVADRVGAQDASKYIVEHPKKTPAARALLNHGLAVFVKMQPHRSDQDDVIVRHDSSYGNPTCAS